MHTFWTDPYGLRVTAIALAGHPLWRSKVGLEAGGSIALGYLTISYRNAWGSDLLFFFSLHDCSLQHSFVPVGEYREPRPVIEEYGTFATYFKDLCDYVSFRFAIFTIQNYKTFDQLNPSDIQVFLNNEISKYAFIFGTTNIHIFSRSYV